MHHLTDSAAANHESQQLEQAHLAAELPATASLAAFTTYIFPSILHLHLSIDRVRLAYLRTRRCLTTSGSSFLDYSSARCARWGKRQQRS